MVHFKAFRGVHPRPESKDVDDIVSVPYDVISYEDASVQGKQNAKSFLHVCSFFLFFFFSSFLFKGV